MTPNTQTCSGLSQLKNPRPAIAQKQLAAILLSETAARRPARRSRANCTTCLRALDADDRHRFQRYLAAEFQPDKAALRLAAQRYLADSTAQAPRPRLAQAADPPRQELLRRMNMAPRRHRPR